MSKIIEFPIERANEKVKPVCLRSAEVVIFPGVRIERRDLYLVSRDQRVSTKSKRKPAIN